MRFKYENGMRVKLRDDRDHKGIITDAEDDYEVMVQWDNKEQYSEPTYEETRFLMPDDPAVEQAMQDAAKQIQAKIDKATHSLEACFAALREAHKMETGDECNDGFHRFRENPLLDMSKLEDIIQDNGWSVSSIYC